MTREQLIEQITAQVLSALKEQGVSEDFVPGKPVGDVPVEAPVPQHSTGTAAFTETSVRELASDALKDLAESEYKETIRIGIGRDGERLTTKAMLSLRADHAMAKDAVLKPVDEGLLQRMDLPLIQSKCEDIDTHLTRPDLGRQLSDEAKAFLQQHCEKNPQIQVYVSDGLSNSAVEHNIEDLLPILMDGLKADGIRVGTPFFVKYGRVPTMDAVSEAVGAELTCVLLGERPGLAASDSMSAYITYGAYVGIPESKRTVVSNIHQHGIQPVEAGAYLVELLERILNEQKSGVDLQL